MPVEREVIRARTALLKFVEQADLILMHIRKKDRRSAALKVLELKERAFANVQRIDKLIDKKMIDDQRKNIGTAYTTTLTDPEIE